MDDNYGELVECMEVSVSSGCGCKEVYRFPHIIYPCSSCICSFLSTFLFIFNNFFVLVPVHFCNLFNIFPAV